MSDKLKEAIEVRHLIDREESEGLVFLSGKYKIIPSSRKIVLENIENLTHLIMSLTQKLIIMKCLTQWHDP